MGGKRKELQVEGAEAEAEAEDGPEGRGRGGSASPRLRRPACAEQGQARTHMLGLQSRSLYDSEWVVSGLPAGFSPAACGVRTETKQNKSRDTAQTGPIGGAGASLTSHGEAGARIRAAGCSL